MKKMTLKKVMAVLMTVALAGSLAACGGRNGNSQSSDSGEDGGNASQVIQEEENQTAESNMEDSSQVDEAEATAQEESEAEGQAQEPSEQPEDGAAVSDTEDNAESMSENNTESGKTLVVYYSATGHTEGVAGYIAAATNADMFELEPAQAYSSADLNWSDENSRVVYEHDNPEARQVELVAATVDNWDSYDTVFIGYPIWWHIAAWPVDGFIAANDFTGKTVIPFCTSSSSDLGESGTLLAEAAGTGNWLEGERFSSGASEEEVREWVESLGLN